MDGKKFRAMRIELGLGLKELGKILGVDKKDIYHWEQRGVPARYIWGLKTLQRLSKALPPLKFNDYYARLYRAMEEFRKMMSVHKDESVL